MNIGIKINDGSFRYDAYHLVKSFFNKGEVSIFTPEEREEQKKNQDINIDIFLGSHDISISFSDGKDKKSDSIKAPIDKDSRKEVKNLLKRLLYNLLEKQTGRSLPWGTLSGIRPTKIPYGILQRGGTEEEAVKYMEDVYFTESRKAELATGIAARELNILSKLGEVQKGYSIYVSIPFCPSVCSYCSFSAGPIDQYKDTVDDYLDSLISELEAFARSLERKKLYTVYIGGGTPTALSKGQLERLLYALYRTYPIKEALEFTLEAGRPDTITMEKLDVLKTYGVSRISINPQTMNDKTLKLIGREHTAEDTARAFKMARAKGFDNINMDIIEGLPDESLEDKIHTLREIEALDPDALTVHSLALKRAALLSTERDIYGKYTFENSERVMELAALSASQMDMAPYYLYRQKNMKGELENIGFAKPGKEGLYNMLIMEERQSVMAFGAGAVTKGVYGPAAKTMRGANVKDVKSYIERIDEMKDRKAGILNVLFADT